MLKGYTEQELYSGEENKKYKHYISNYQNPSDIFLSAEVIILGTYPLASIV